jgi:hypothetical protein
MLLVAFTLWTPVVKLFATVTFAVATMISTDVSPPVEH